MAKGPRRGEGGRSGRAVAQGPGRKVCSADSRWGSGERGFGSSRAGLQQRGCSLEGARHVAGRRGPGGAVRC